MKESTEIVFRGSEKVRLWEKNIALFLNNFYSNVLLTKNNRTCPTEISKKKIIIFIKVIIIYRQIKENNNVPKTVQLKWQIYE